MNELIQTGVISELTGTQNVQYVLNENSAFALTEFKVLRSQGKNFIKCAKVLYNGKIKLLYFSSMFKSLRNMLPSLDGDTFLSIIANILNSIIEIKNNGFLSCSNLDLSFDKVFVDQNTLEVKLIYIPVNNANTDVATVENEFRTEIIKLISSVPAFSSEKMTRVCGYLSNGTLALPQLYNSICSEIKNGTFKKQVYTDDKKNNKPSNEREIFKQPQLHFVSVNAPVNIHFVIETPEFVIGKNPSQVNGAITFNKAISRVHCKISYQNNSYFITDLGSANGTYINNSKIGAQHPQPIKSGDIIRLANSDFKIQY